MNRVSHSLQISFSISSPSGLNSSGIPFSSVRTFSVCRISC